MTTANPPTAAPARSRLRISEDWLATAIGLLIVLLIGLGALGQGPQTVRVSAAPGEIQNAQLPALDGWQVSATLDGKSAPVAGAVTALAEGGTVIVTCRDGALAAAATDTPPDGVTAPAGDHAQVVVDNRCDAPVVVTYSKGAAIRWPVFRLFE